MKIQINLYILCFFIGGVASAQTPISLDEAYSIAFKNNPDVKREMLRAEYQDKIKNSYRTIDPLTVSGEVGQIASAYIDNKFSVSQNFKLPGFYSKQKEVLEQTRKSSLQSIEIQKWKLKREVGLAYNELNYLNEKERLLKRADSLFTQYYTRANLRLKKGESNILEKTTAENYRAEAEIQLKNLLRDREAALIAFNTLLNDEKIYIAETSDFYKPLIPGQISALKSNHLLLQQLQQQKEVEEKRLAAEKARLMPDFIFSYNNASMYGVGADDRFYDRSSRFHSGQIGVAIPLFTGAQKSVIEGQKINILLAENEYAAGTRNLARQFATLQNDFEKLKSQTEYYKTKGVQNAETVLKTANRLSNEGEINYLEWTLLVNQSLEIYTKLVESQKQLNDTIILLNNLTNE